MPSNSKKVYKAAGPRKLTFKETRELESLPQKIEAMETEQQERALISQAKASIEGLEQSLAITYERWEELETINSNGKKLPTILSQDY